MEEARHERELTPEQTRKMTNPATLGFETTATLPAPERMVGQTRAADAIDFALEIADKRYNLYITGEPGTGRHAAATAAATRIAATRPPSPDWLYTYNFAQPTEPRAISLPSGMGRPFARAVDGFILACRRELRRAFGDTAYTRRRAALLSRDEARHSQLLEQLSAEALALGFLIQGTPSGLAIIPARPPIPPSPTPSTPTDLSTPDAEPQPLSREEYDKLPPADRQRLRANRERVEAIIERILPQIHTIEENARARMRKIDRDTASQAIDHLTSALRDPYAAYQPILDFLHHLRHDIITHADVLAAPSDADSDHSLTTTSLPTDDANHDTLDQPDAPDLAPNDDSADDATTLSDDSDDSDDSESPTGAVPLDDDLRNRPTLLDLLRRYKVNTLITNKPSDHAPIIQEPNPTYTNLLGAIAIGQYDGAPYADHLMIRPGALHRANGGYLILQARDLLSAPHSWDAIKRMLRFGSIAAEPNPDAPNNPGGPVLRPEPIPAHIKVILVGDLHTYATLADRDPLFTQLFKVRADFDTDMPRSPDTEAFYARFAGEASRVSGGPPLSASAVALLIEEGSRWTEDQNRLSTLLGALSDLTTEACFWARRDAASQTTRRYVAQAIAARERRVSLIPDKLDILIRQGVLMIDTTGDIIGQVNGLSVLTIGEHSFGKPMRITARTAPGWTGILNIERETQMSGPSHTKGVLTLAGYLTGRYGQELPLSLAASTSFEQVYDEVDGDSASSAELYAILSSLAQVPIRQTLAVTGSVNQLGEVQAVGGVTAKVEAFYRLCRDRGLTGEQGVLIPRANIRNLMLREEVVEAIRNQRFHIFAISTIEEGIQLLTGIPAGKPDANGRSLEGTINARITQTLRAYAERIRAFAPGLGSPRPPH